jgi:adenylate cyclase, class 2
LLYLKNPGAATGAQVCQRKKVLAQVKKLRKIFFIDNVKFYLDHLEELGCFVEIEAIDLDGAPGIEVLRQQCNYYKELLRIAEEDLIKDSCIDL